MSEHRYDIRISESSVDLNRLMVERQDPDNFPLLQTRERCVLEIAAYVFKALDSTCSRLHQRLQNSCKAPAISSQHDLKSIGTGNLY